MPTYEMPILYRIMTKPELVGSLKRTAESIFEKGGIIRKIDNLGIQATPFKIKAYNQTHREANYFIFHFDVAPIHLNRLLEGYTRDVDILKSRIYNNFDEPEFECTLHEELLPPAYRPDVQKMLKVGEKQRRVKEKHKFNFNTGLDYYPFQR